MTIMNATRLIGGFFGGGIFAAYVIAPAASALHWSRGTQLVIFIFIVAVFMAAARKE